MAPFPVRLRHPKGVSTIQVDGDSSIEELQQLIFSVSEIPPSLQELKSGYPPRAITLIPEQLVSTLNLSSGDQLIVIAASGGFPPNSAASPPISTFGQPTTLSQSRPSSAASSIRREKPAIQAGKRQAEPAEHVLTDGGALVLRVVPDDNSCLFSSIAVIFEQDMGAAGRLRQVVTDAIRNDPETYSDAFLGQPREDYIKAILKPSTWGGAIELSIFAAHYRTEITSIDVETGRRDRFGGDKWENRCIVMYSGIHYDALSLAPTPNAPLDFHQTVFPVALGGEKDDDILRAANELATRLRKERRFTNTATFSLRCERCGKGLKGEKEARAHAKETGHADFGEY